MSNGSAAGGVSRLDGAYALDVKKRQQAAQESAFELSPAERAELQRQLEGGNGMKSIHEAYGAFAALATAPRMVSPNQWLFTILGEPNFGDMAQAQRVFDLVVRAYNSVLDDLAGGRSVFPAGAPEGDVAAWCRGYLAIAGRDDEWMADEVANTLLMPFEVVGGKDDAPQRERARKSLPRLVDVLYDFFAATRDELAGAPPPRGKPPRGK